MIEVIDTHIPQVVYIRAELLFEFYRSHNHYAGEGSLADTVYVTLPTRISSCATRHALIEFETPRGGAPDCSCRARRAAPFTRLYLFWSGSLSAIDEPPGR